MRFPTVFMEEGSKDEIARVGFITRLGLAGKELNFEFYFDDAIDPLPNSKLLSLSRSLDVENFEFSRTHWAVKNVDLFQVLLKNRDSKRLMPKVFKIFEQPQNGNLISIMMPFDAGFHDVHVALKASIESLGKQCKRVDDIWNHDAIVQDVVQLICLSDIVICDLSGKNANVFYEAGIAHTLGKEVIMITQSSDDVPFDLRHLRHIKYLNNGEGLDKLASKVIERINKIYLDASN